MPCAAWIFTRAIKSGSSLRFRRYVGRQQFLHTKLAGSKPIAKGNLPEQANAPAPNTISRLKKYAISSSKILAVHVGP